MKFSFKEIIKEIKKNLAYNKEEADEIRVAISKVMDRTLLKPTLDTNTFANPDDEVDKDRYKWFRDNPSEYIEAYYGNDEEDEEDISLQNIAAGVKKHGAIRDPKETTLLYYLYKGTYQDKFGKWHIGNGQNIDLVIKEINDRANQFVDAIGDFQQTIDFFFADYNKVKQWTHDYVDFASQPESLVSQFMSKGAPGGFKRLEFGKFTRDTAYQATNTQGLGGTRDHMYKGSREFDNIPDEHKPYFLFDYIWMACYNKAQEDGLRSSEKIVPPLSVQDFNLNYQNGLTKQQDAALFGGGWLEDVIGKSKESKETISAMSSGLLVASLANPYLPIAPPNNHLMSDDEYNNYRGKKVSLSQMSDEEISGFFNPYMNKLLEITKEALKMNQYPSGMIQFLKFKDTVPEVLLKNYRRKYNRTIKGMELAGYLDANGNFTNKVKDKDLKATTMVTNHLANFESSVKEISKQIKSGLVSNHSIDTMYEKFDLIDPSQQKEALEILKKHGVNTQTIKAATVEQTEKVDEAYKILYSIDFDQITNKATDNTKYKQVLSILDMSTPKEKEDIIKIIKYFKNRGVK